MTPYELTVHIEEHHKREKFMQNERISAAYYGAYFGRVKNWPRLEDILKEKPKENQEQAAVDMFAEVKRLNAMFGGTVT
ncbi:hypothetical protein ACFPES_03290 [Paenibacillus sp. GCM10023248]|uniref:hypothetical protein n=1 Tax=unclassified Paenibacillus TaxID=185978 RepID=UPI00237834F5|nr:hypothetical protein [Paenibacillus sp. MAHUQ-63]MDD9266050.1 hypothetical protein [Paenibacillus sp. MAHUQ-63]